MALGQNAQSPVLISFSGYGLFIEELSGSDAICEVDNISKL